MGIVAQVAAALDAAHAAGLVHRDVKPGNILVVPGVAGQHRDHVYLSDFGLTKRVTSLSGVTAQGQFIATMDYAAPEQIGSRPVDARTDVYGLGCVAYQCLTGTVPFVRDNEAALLWAHLVERPPPVSAHRQRAGPLRRRDRPGAGEKPRRPVRKLRPIRRRPRRRPRRRRPHRHLQPGGQPHRRTRRRTCRRRGHPHPGGRIRSHSRHPHPGDLGPAHPDRPPPGQHRRTGCGASPPDHPTSTPGGTPLATPTRTRTIGRTAHTPHPTHASTRTARAASVTTTCPMYRPPLGAAGRDGAPVGCRPDSRPGPSRRRRRPGRKNVRGGGSNSSATVAAATQQCRAAYASADQALPKGQDVANQLRVHAGIMQMGDASSIVAGRPALTAGAAAAAVYQDRAASYKPLAAECAKNGAATQACKARVAGADQAVKHADNVVTDLMQHTAIMNRWDSGQLTAEEAHMQGKPSLDAGLAEANALDQSVHDYQQQAGNC